MRDEMTSEKNLDDVRETVRQIAGRNACKSRQMSNKTWLLQGECAW